MYLRLLSYAVCFSNKSEDQLPVAQGGIGIPNASIELRTMSATTVSHWARDVPHYERLIGDIALSNARRRTSPYIMPSDISSIRDSDWPKTLWESGAAMMMTTHDTTGSVPTPQQAARCAEYLAKAYSKGTWDQGNFEIDASHEMEHGLEEFIRVRAAESGTFCPEWLPHCPTQEDGWLRDRQGPLYKISGLQFVQGTSRLGEVIDWTWIKHGCIRFRLLNCYDSTSAPTIRSFQRLCYVLVYNFPELLHQHREPRTLRPVDETLDRNHLWSLRQNETLEYQIDGELRATHQVQTTSDLDAAGALDRGCRQEFHVHPIFSRLICLRGGGSKWKTSRKKYKAKCAHEKRRLGEIERDKKIAKRYASESRDILVLDSMNQLKWTDLGKIPGLSAMERQLLLRVKSASINSYDWNESSSKCPHTLCRDSQKSTIDHIFWKCPVAQAVWKQLQQWWRGIVTIPSEELSATVFSLDLPDLPVTAYERLQAMGPLEDVAIESLHTVATGLWRFTCAIGMGVIWRQRQNLLMKTKFVKTGCHAAAAAFQLRLRSGLRCFEYLAEKYAGDAEAALAVTKAVIQLFFTDQGEATRIYEPAPRETFLLYFDGGSRGNPGPGGAGAVIVHIAAGEAVPRLVWVASMAYGNASTTNNYAEYQGLLIGLKAATASRFTPLHVIGDSQLIINQFREHRSPKNAKLRDLNRRCQQQLYKIGSVSWTHHFREYNKMADMAANIAMDTNRSFQCAMPSPRSELTQIARWMYNDVGFWLEAPAGLPRPSWIEAQELRKNMEALLRPPTGEAPLAP